jgi:O-acetyl-ADP-ribose deacetylase (regulator of RNase III)
MAYQITKYYPEAKAAYLKKFREVGWSVGEVQFVFLAEKIICNMALQDTYGRTGVHTDLKACKAAFDILFKFCHESGFGVSLPKVGSGLGGGRWSEIERILLESLKPYSSVEVDIYYL